MPESQDPLKIALASALVKTGKPDEALDLLDRLHVETIPQPDRDRVLWIHVAALQSGGRKREAAIAVRDLASRPGEFQEAARRLARQD
jgi:pentatricopeptide repeat protein